MMESPMIGGYLFISLLLISGVASQCTKNDYQHCVKLADPLLKDPHLIYPDNPSDIEHVCKVWSNFVDCVKRFTDRCFTEKKKQEFNKAVENPITSIHKLCSMPDYRQDYMRHAPCMKMTLTRDTHCGRHYKHLVAQVSGEAPRVNICCSHHMFRACVLDQTQSTCDKDAAPYSAQMLDKALSFLRDQCSNFVPNRVDCPGSDFYPSTSGAVRTDSTMTYTIPSHPLTTHTMTTQTLTTSPVASHGVTTNSQGPHTMSSRPQPPPNTYPAVPDHQTHPMTRTSPSSPSNPERKTTMTRTSPIPWMPSTDSRGMSTSETVEWSPTGGTTEGVSRTSWGRGMTWSSSQAPWWPSRPQDPPMRNDLDEPNQQGLGSGAPCAFPTLAFFPLAFLPFALPR